MLDLNTSISNVAPMIRRLMGENIDFQTILGAQNGRVIADPGQIEQVIINLIINARDALEEGGKLTIETSNVDLDDVFLHQHPTASVVPGPYVMFSVADTGVGMTPETQARVFEPFFTTKEKGEGMGLGLATVYGVVKQSHGYIGVDSQSGVGTTFRIYLPRTDEIALPLEAHSDFQSILGKETILLVEDQPDLQELTAIMLEEKGYKLLTAGSPAQALQITEGTQNIDLLITDVVLPEMNGRMLAERIRKDRPTIKVLFVSGYTDNIITHHGELDASTSFLPKPYTSQALGQKVRDLLDY